MLYETKVTIRRPIEEVWAFLVDRFNMPRWNTGWLTMRPTSPGPPGLGATFQARLTLLGFEFPLTGVISEWEPPRAATLSVRGGPFRAALLQVQLQGVGAETTVVRISDLELRPIFKPLLWIAGPFLRHRADAFNQNLKRLLETEPPLGETRR